MLVLAVAAAAAPLSEPLFPVALPEFATTGDGQTAERRQDGTWVLGPPAPVEVPVQTAGGWTIAVQRSPTTGVTTGGAWAPNLDGAGYLGMVCDGVTPVAVVGWSGALADVDLRATGERVKLEVPYRKRGRRLVGTALGAGEAALVPTPALLEVVLDEPRDELRVAEVRRGRPAWAEGLRLSLDGFVEAWARVEAACQGRPETPEMWTLVPVEAPAMPVGTAP